MLDIFLFMCYIDNINYIFIIQGEKNMIMYFKSYHCKYEADDYNLSVKFSSVVCDESSLIYLTKPDFENFLTFAFKCFEVIEIYIFSL